jgi:hypothetical protein
LNENLNKKCITPGCNQTAWSGRLYCNKCLLNNYFIEQKQTENKLENRNKLQNKNKLKERGK